MFQSIVVKQDSNPLISDAMRVLLLSVQNGQRRSLRYQARLQHDQGKLPEAGAGTHHQAGHVCGWVWGWGRALPVPLQKHHVGPLRQAHAHQGNRDQVRENGLEVDGVVARVQNHLAAGEQGESGSIMTSRSQLLIFSMFREATINFNTNYSFVGVAE